jgi:hypothetical protein
MAKESKIIIIIIILLSSVLVTKDAGSDWWVDLLDIH